MAAVFERAIRSRTPSALNRRGCFMEGKTTYGICVLESDAVKIERFGILIAKRCVSECIGVSREDVEAVRRKYNILRKCALVSSAPDLLA